MTQTVYVLTKEDIKKLIDEEFREISKEIFDRIEALARRIDDFDKIGFEHPPLKYKLFGKIFDTREQIEKEIYQEAQKQIEKINKELNAREQWEEYRKARKQNKINNELEKTNENHS